LNKIIILIFFLINTLWANIGTNEDLKVLKELGLESSFLSDSEVINIYNEYSSKNKINYYRNVLKKSSLNAQIVRTEIENENLHEATFFIPMIESSFVNQTRGKNSPGGLWQIIPDTAKHLKLRNDEFIDERLDLIKSTDAASSYLKRYYKKFDNKWYLSILAYNCGEGRVIEAITRASLDRYLELNPNRTSGILRSFQRTLDDYKRTKRGISDLYTIYGELQGMEIPFDFEYLIKNNKQKQYLPESTLSYIKKIIIFSILSNRNVFDDIRKSPYQLEKVKLPKGVSLKSVALAIDFNSSELEKINKHIKKQVLAKDSNVFNFYIPKSKLEIYNKKVASIKPINEKNEIEIKKNVDKKITTSKKSERTTNKNKPLIYKVKKGDSFESIAKEYKVSAKKLKSDNKKKSNLINIGDSIEIYK
jgi:membrane-bound lytic murein transglycosylase D